MNLGPVLFILGAIAVADALWGYLAAAVTCFALGCLLLWADSSGYT